MSLVSEQAVFLLDVCKLIQHATDNGLTVTASELYRTVEQQEIYLKTGRSKTMNSHHLKRLAVDLNFFRGGKLLGTRDDMKAIGEYWESLNQKNRWGGSWRGAVDAGRSSFIDAPHFERMA